MNTPNSVSKSSGNELSESTTETPPSKISARGAALAVLSEWLKKRGALNLREELERVVAGGSLSAQDKGLATELVMGTARHRLTLAWLAGQFATHGWERISPKLQPVLLLGMYQILWLDRVPDFAAVNEAVQQARDVAGQGSSRFVNAVLRNMIRALASRRKPLAEADKKRTLPLDHEFGVELQGVYVPDPEEDANLYLSITTSHPLWLVERWISRYGLEETRRMCTAGLVRPPLVVRPNLLRTTAELLVERLQREGVEAHTTGDGWVEMQATGSMASLAAFREGWFQPQDRTAGEVVRQMDVKPGDVVVDTCAGSGTKATQLAEKMNDQGTVIASDKEQWRLDLLGENCKRLGIESIQCVRPEQLAKAVADAGGADWILVDVPCSNTGVLGRRPEARYRINAENVTALAEIQRELFEQALELAEQRTRIVYSTCSLEAEENERLMTRLGRAFPDWELEEGKLTLPGCDEEAGTWRDGGYWARWRLR